MSAKCLDQQGRWRNKVVAFRMSPEPNKNILSEDCRKKKLWLQEIPGCIKL